MLQSLLCPNSRPSVGAGRKSSPLASFLNSKVIKFIHYFVLSTNHSFRFVFICVFLYSLVPCCLSSLSPSNQWYSSSFLHSFPSSFIVLIFYPAFCLPFIPIPPGHLPPDRNWCRWLGNPWCEVYWRQYWAREIVSGAASSAGRQRRLQVFIW